MNRNSLNLNLVMEISERYSLVRVRLDTTYRNYKDEEEKRIAKKKAFFKHKNE